MHAKLALSLFPHMPRSLPLAVRPQVSLPWDVPLGAVSPFSGSIITGERHVKTTSKLLAAALLASAFATPAMAAGYPYVALDIGQSKAKDACTTAAGTTAPGCKDSAGALRIALGSEFSPQFSGEISIASYGSADLVPATGNKWKLSGVQLAGIGALPLNDEVALTGKIGLASTTVNISGPGGASATSTNLMFGVGMRFKVNSDMSIRVQYENLGTVGDTATTGTAKVSLFSAGVAYQF
jgi:opacity protein-like surface antigen